VRGLMQDYQLTLPAILKRAEELYGKKEIVSRNPDKSFHRYTYADFVRRSKKLAVALGELGLEKSDRVVTLAWNTHQHLEAYFGVPSANLILHTLNPRLSANDLAYIINHAEDKVLLIDETLVELLDDIEDEINLEYIFVLSADGSAPEGLESYEDLLEGADEADFEYPDLDENDAAALCYTSGTTGRPKGALYSHRSVCLHSFALTAADGLGIRERDVVLPVVPMFHVNAWGLPYAACMVGAKLVFPGAGLDGKSLYDLFEAEQVTVSAGVPTVWQALLAHVESNGLKFSTMKRTVIGGSACPPAMLRKFGDDHGVHVLHAWGMTEMSPLGTVSSFKPQHAGLTGDARYAVMSKQGRVVFGVDMKTVDDAGNELPWGSEQSGDLLVRGPWILSRYFKDEGGDPLVDGWFPTGDVARIDNDGYMLITDRSKDVIKSGGEWIGSIDLENIAVAHPAVAMAACIAAHHPKWDERPLLVVVKKPGAEATREELLAFFEGKIAKWWTPDDVVFVDAIPLGATGKMQKNKLREQFKDYKLPTA